jgi:competence protein ComEC
LIWISLRYPDQYVHLIFCDVGQGDGVLITHGFHQVVIDGGRDNKMLDCLKRYLPLWDNQIELMVSTQPDEDHMGGLIPLLQQYQVKQLLMSSRGKDTLTFANFLRVVKERQKQGLHAHVPSFHQIYRIDPFVSFLIMSPIIQSNTDSSSIFNQSETRLWDSSVNSESIKDSINNESIGLFLTVGKVKIAFTADMEKEAELALVGRGLLEDVDILKVAHHGSKTSSTREFLEEIRPEVSIISCGKKNKYGHPHAQTLEQLTAIGSQIFRTDKEGTIEIVTDGKKYWRRKGT